MKLISDEKIAILRRAKVMPAVTARDVEDGVKFFMEDAAQAQLEACEKEAQEKVREIFEWLYMEYGFELQPQDKQKWGVE